MRLALVVVMALLLSGCGETHDEKMARTCGTPEMAYQESKSVVRGELKSPSSAKFHGSIMDRGVEYEKVDNCTTRIVSSFDAQNGFGAMVRHDYRVTMVYDRASDTWKYRGLEITPR